MLKNNVKKFIPIRMVALHRFIKDVKKNGLLQKKKFNKDIKSIIFIIQFPETWGSCESVYKELISKNIKTYILCVPKFSMKNENYIFKSINDRKNEAYDYFIKKGYSFIIRADKGDSTWYDINDICPDLIIYTRPYNQHYPKSYRSSTLKNYQLCYIPYGYNMIGGSVLNGMFNNDFIRNIDICFATNKSSFNYLQKYLFWYRIFGNVDLKFLGFPRFDLINTKNDDRYIKTISWLPRWTARDVNQEQKGSHFIDYYEKILEFAENNEEFEIIIRPHPLMFDNFIEKNVMSEIEVNSFIQKCNQMTNVRLDIDEDYFPLLEKTDILIADVTSLMIEFFYSNISIIYCDDTANFSNEVLRMTDMMYKANNWNQISNIIFEIKNNGDKYSSSRLEYIKNAKINKCNGTIGKNIADYLTNVNF